MHLLAISNYLQLSTDEIFHEAFTRDKNDLHLFVALLKLEAFSNLRRPVLVTFDLAVLFCFC
jgi:hypothetical protein